MFMAESSPLSKNACLTFCKDALWSQHSLSYGSKFLMPLMLGCLEARKLIRITEGFIFITDAGVDLVKEWHLEKYKINEAEATKIEESGLL
jgi:predicted methyltransferase